jgi:hypothetical protein
MSDGSFNPADRRLCPDGSCIGLVGSDGRCRVCGRAGDGSAAASVPAWNAGQRDHDSDDHSLSAGEADSGAEAGSGTFQPDRRLCDDGSCVGVIGAGDVCSVCGRPAGS